jgi:hypothetical protein
MMTSFFAPKAAKAGTESAAMRAPSAGFPATANAPSAGSAAATAPSALGNIANVVDMEDDVIAMIPPFVAQGLLFQDEQFVSYLAPVAVPTTLMPERARAHVAVPTLPTVAYCSGFAPPASIGGEAWMAWFPFLRFQEDGLPFVINGLRWHSQNCARGHFQTNAASGVNDECENLNTLGRPSYSAIQRYAITSTSSDHTCS